MLASRIKCIYIYNTNDFAMERRRPMKGRKRPTLKFLLNHDNQFNKEIADVKTASESNI
jgi:hypothetical protein